MLFVTWLIIPGGGGNSDGGSKDALLLNELYGTYGSPISRSIEITMLKIITCAYTYAELSTDRCFCDCNSFAPIGRSLILVLRVLSKRFTELRVLAKL